MRGVTLLVLEPPSQSRKRPMHIVRDGELWLDGRALCHVSWQEFLTEISPNPTLTTHVSKKTVQLIPALEVWQPKTADVANVGLISLNVTAAANKMANQNREWNDAVGAGVSDTVQSLTCLKTAIVQSDTDFIGPTQCDMLYQVVCTALQTNNNLMLLFRLRCCW